MNIWTHFLGFLITICLLFYTWSLSLPQQDIILLSLFLILGSYTLLSSSLFHMHICIDARAYHIFGCLDFSGISASLAASSIALTYILYTCTPSWRIPLTFVLVAVNTVGIIGPLIPGWMTPAFRTGRCLIYLVSGLVSLIPTIYLLSTASSHFTIPIPSDALYLLLATLLQHLVGAILYTQRLPERCFPGAFDFAFSSHSIFHILVFTASVSLYKALLVLVTWKQNLVCIA
jgi:adiponectin receptor